MPRRVSVAVSLTLLLTIEVIATASVQRAPPPILRGVLIRAAAYLERFEREFAVVVSDEDYLQQIGDQPWWRLPKSLVRRTRSEMVFLWLPHEQLWLTARSVLAVDGTPVHDSIGEMDRALADPDARVAELRRLRDRNARFNLGRIYRNFNDPTFALQFLDARLQPRFRWVVDGQERLNDTDTIRIEFSEQRRPTLIRRHGTNLPATGLVWIEPETGTVHRTRLLVYDAELNTHAHIEVLFAPDPKLGVVAPRRMEETYSQRNVGVGLEERVFAYADYSNYRRFETSGRIVWPQ